MGPPRFRPPLVTPNVKYFQAAKTQPIHDPYTDSVQLAKYSRRHNRNIEVSRPEQGPHWLIKPNVGPVEKWN